MTTLRAEVRESLLTAMNGRLKELEEASASLGVEIERIDMTAYLPPEAKTAFDAVLLATQAADRGIAECPHRRRAPAPRGRARARAVAERRAGHCQGTGEQGLGRYS